MESSPSPGEVVCKVFEQLSEWRKTRKTTKRNPLKFKWSQFHLSVIQRYVLKLKITADSALLQPATLLNQEFSNKAWATAGNSSKHDEKVASFMHALHEVFVVPKRHQLFERDTATKKDGQVAAFIDLILKLLQNRPGSANSLENRIVSLQKKLRFLFAVLGDESFICKAQDLWAEFEAVANKAGAFVHLIIFSTEADPTDDRFGALLRRMDHLQSRIIKLSKQQQVIAEANIELKTPAANSIFVFSSLLFYIEDVLNREHGTIADVKDPIKTLQQELKLSESLINHPETEEWKEYGLPIRGLAYEAEYLINSFLDGDDAPHSHRYLSIRLSHVISKIKFIKSEIETKKSLSNYFARLVELPLQNKSSSDLGQVIEDNENESLSSRENLSKLFEQLTEWTKTKRDTLKFKWSEFHLSVIHGYVLKLKIVHFSLLTSFSLLNQEFSEEKLVSFMRSLHQIFVVPKQQQLFERDATIKKSGLIAAFIDMLLRLLHDWPSSDRLESLKKRLRFLLAVLGDEPFILNIQDLCEEFEAVANKAGSLVHLIIFSTEADPIDERIFRTLMRAMDDLEAQILKLSNQQQGIDDTWITRKTADSLFIVDSLVHDLEDVLNREDTIADVKDQIKTLQQELQLMNSLTKHQEKEEFKEYVLRIRDVAYEVEYLINSLFDGDDVHKYLSNRLSHVYQKINNIKLGIQGSKKHFDNDIPRFKQLSLKNQSSGDLGDIVGIEDKEMEILWYLEGGKQDLQIVSIVGMAGLGKTTLARKVYHHPSLKYKFDVCSWGVVSQQYEKKSVLMDILSTLQDVYEKEEMLNLKEESLTTMIHQYLYNRRYFFIMDDLWSLDAWFDLQACFPNNRNGSRILLTSRNRNVAPAGSIICELPPMSDEHCWELLRKKVFRNMPCPPELLSVGQKIVKNCRGLPLAVVVIAGILSSKDTKEESTWKEVEKNLATYILSDESNSIMQIVELSYNNLPDHLKTCFLYFGAYRKRKRIAVGHLLRLWIAEGFLCREQRNMAKSAAEGYLRELIDRSLVTVVKTSLDGRVKACTLHDLLHEFCIKRCKDEILHSLVDKNYSMLNEKHQRFCILDFVNSPRSPQFGLHVRSILGCFPRTGFLNMKLLRVLVLNGIMCYGGLNEIKVLVNLRCLVIGYGSSPSKLEELKLAVISSLVNLEFLQVKSQFYLVCTPADMAKMIKLRHLTVNSEVRFGEESINTTNNNLEFLSKVTIRELKDENMLRCSPHLRQLKCKCFPLNVEETGQTRYPDFSFFTQLESLHVEAGHFRILEDISFPLNVKELSLSGLFLPWEKISVIGKLENLEFLKLQYCGTDHEVWETRDGEFQQLRWLTIKSCYGLREWRVESSSHFPRLRRLMLDDCLHLQEFPWAIGDIPTLEAVEIKGPSPETLVESARQVEEQQREDGNEVLKFHIDRITRFTSETASSFFYSVFG